VFGVLRTTEAASTSSGLWWSYGVIVAVYTAMTVGAAIVLRSMARRWRDGEGADLPTPYGPSRSGRS
jgi:cytochrome d ubiquinol oxidase subunit I